MIALLQRVLSARVQIEGETVGEIGAGLMVLVCAERDDTAENAYALLDRLVRYRVFGDDAGRMNRSLLDLEATLSPSARQSDKACRDAAGLLLVPQFTLAADTSSGLRPGFSGGADPALAASRFDDFVGAARSRVRGVQTGRFGADMQVNLTNDGPVTFWLQWPRQAKQTPRRNN